MSYIVEIALSHMKIAIIIVSFRIFSMRNIVIFLNFSVFENNYNRKR